MKGIVYRTADGKVLYKFDTPVIPTLNLGEAIKQRNDINDIKIDAVYNAGTDTYSNPAVALPTDWKGLYAAAATDSQKIAVIAQKLDLV